MLEILLCVRQDLVRTGLRAVLESEPEWSVVSTAPQSTGDLVALLDRIAPDVIVADLSSSTVLSAAQTGPAPNVPVVVIGDAPEVEDIRQALRDGARGVVVNDDDSSQHVIEAVRAVAGGYAYLTPSVTSELLSWLSSVTGPAVDTDARDRLDSLTEREREVLRLIALGRSTAEVAAELRLSRATVKSHVSHALPKLGVRDRAEAVALAHRAGLVTVD